jgi:nicotinate-nucleotide adenylyltransferase
MFIPDDQPPHKELPPGSPTPAQRLQLVETAVRDLAYASVSDMELSRGGRSYTSDTLAALKAQHPEDTLYLITGTDMFLTLHSWHAPEEICKLAVIVGMSRAEEDRREELEAQKNHLEQQFGAQVRLVENEFVEISSTKVRRLLLLGGAEKYLPQPVLEEIRAQGLYGLDRDYRGLETEELRQVAVSLLKPRRVPHVLGCAETAVRLAQRWGADETVALRAGLLHDITKAIDGEDQLLLVDKYDILISDFERTHPKLLHAKTGAAVAKAVFGESDAVSQAIYWHTTGRPDMTLMEKIIYLADYMEPTRDFPGVEPLRDLAFRDLDRALLQGYDLCIDELIRERKPLCSDTLEAREFLRQQLGVTAQ